MKYALLALSASLSLAIDLSAQTITVTQTTRTATAGAYGFDYDFNGGALLNEAAPAATGPWAIDLDADVTDYYAFAVGRGRAIVDTEVAPTDLSFDLETTATTAGHHFQADSQGESAYDVAFDVTQRVRYALDVHVEATTGYNDGTVALRLGTTTIAQRSVFGGGIADLVQSGWLQVGSYELTGTAAAFAYGTHGQPDAQLGIARCTLRILDAADIDLDGDVDLADRLAYMQAWLAGDDEADMDGDGNVTRDDGRMFIRAWRRAI